MTALSQSDQGASDGSGSAWMFQLSKSFFILIPHWTTLAWSLSFVIIFADSFCLRALYSESLLSRIVFWNILSIKSATRDLRH